MAAIAPKRQFGSPSIITITEIAAVTVSRACLGPFAYTL